MRSGHTLMGQLLASGEIPVAANIYNHNAERLAVRGAPIRWKALTPTFGRPNAIGSRRRAPHPNAALLFADFLLSREGQTDSQGKKPRPGEPRREYAPQRISVRDD